VEPRELIIKYYRDVLGREPNISGLEGFLEKVKNQEVSIEQIPEILKKSEEYKQITKDNAKIIKKRKKVLKNREKIRKVRYVDISVSYNHFLALGGQNFGQDFIPVVKNIFGKVPRICEFCCGAGYIGFSLLAHGLCESLCLIDINPEAVRMCKKTIEENQLQDKVSVYLSDGLSNVPSSEKWDLVVSNGPSFIKRNNLPVYDYLRMVDPNWKIRKQFYSNAKKFIKPNGSALFLENIEGSMPWLHTEMIIKNGLELVDCFWHKKFNSPRDTFWKYKRLKERGNRFTYYKNILTGLLKPSPFVCYFMWSRNTTNLENL